MKKTLSLCLAVTLVLLLSACGGKTDCVQKIKAAFTAPFDYSVRTASFGFEYTKTPEGAVMVLDSPDTLKGLTVTRTPSGVTASYDGIVVTLPESTVQKLTSLDALADKVCSAIDAGEYTLSTENGVTSLAFASGDTVYTVCCDENGTLTGAKVGENGKTYEFTFIN